MKVVLSTPPGRTTELWPPLGLLYIASSILSKRSDEVRIIDAFCENLTRDELASRVVAERPDVFGMNCSTHTFLDAIGTLERIRTALPATKLVLGGFHATFASEQILRAYPFLDYVVRGEGEVSFPKLLDCIERGTQPAEIEGVSYLQNGVVWSRSPVLIDDLDSLPFPDRRLANRVDYGYFHKNIRLTFGKFTTICSSRGCPFKCAYCSCAAFSQRKWRPRSPENVATELEQLQADGYECAVFVDDNLTHSRARMERLCELIRRKRIDIQFYCEGRVENASYELMRTMKNAGFEVIYFGIESPQRHVLDYYRKTIDPERAAKAVENARKAGMIVVTSYIVGAPVESLADMQKTVDFIKRVRPHAVQINILDCLIGTEIWERMAQAGAVGPDDWKTNHRIYEYGVNGITRGDLEDMVNKGYAAHLDSWKSVRGVASFVGTLFANRAAREIVRGNIFNPAARKRLADGTRYEHPSSNAEESLSRRTVSLLPPSGS